MGAVVAFVGSLIGVAAAAAPAAAVGLGIYSVVEQQRREEEAKEETKRAAIAAEEQAKRELGAVERRAGEYLELSAAQMELQAQQANINTLADLLMGRSRASPVPVPAPATEMFTVPPAKTYGAFDRINQAIDDLVRSAA